MYKHTKALNSSKDRMSALLSNAISAEKAMLEASPDLAKFQTSLALSSRIMHTDNGHRDSGRRRYRWIIVIPTIVLALLLVPSLAVRAQSLSIDLESADHAGVTAHLIQLVSLITVLSLAPSLLVMATAFTRIIIVLSLLRGALNAQGTPPNTVIIGLALFLTYFVMQPTLEQAWTNGIQPMTAGQISQLDGLTRTAEPFHVFMISTARPSDVKFFSNLGHVPQVRDQSATPWRVLVPAFLVSELRRGFEIGFLLYLPFLIIDLVVASILMSLGMMMMPPSSISLPVKLIFFVLIDGWRLVAGSLVQGLPTN